MKPDAPPERTSPLLIGLIVIGGTVLSWLLVQTGPRVTTEEEVKAAKMVKVQELTPKRYPIFVAAHGTVIPARRVSIEPEVSGLILSQHPKLRPGGMIMEGELLFTVDTTLAAIAVEEASAALVQASINLEEATRQHAEALRLASDALIPETELASLLSAMRLQEAAHTRQKALVARSQEMLQRHVLKAPFNAWVLEENVEVGQRLDPGFSAATLVGSDEYWVQVSLPVDQIQHIQLPTDHQPGATAHVYTEMGDTKRLAAKGHVTALRSDLEREGRMARLIVSIQPPEREVEAPLLLGSYVKVEIAAGELEQCLAIQESALRADQSLWVADKEDTLQIRPAKIRWTLEDTIYVAPVLEEGDRLIISPLKSGIPGTALNPQTVHMP